MLGATCESLLGSIKPSSVSLWPLVIAMIIIINTTIVLLKCMIGET